MGNFGSSIKVCFPSFPLLSGRDTTDRLIKKIGCPLYDSYLFPARHTFFRKVDYVEKYMDCDRWA